MGPWAPAPFAGMQPPLSQQGPLMPRMQFPPQPMLDADPRDGPASVAYRLQPSLKQIRMVRPAPNTKQYFNRVEVQPEVGATMRPRDNDICGYVQMAVDNRPDPEANRVE